MSLLIKYRPEKWEAVVGQEPIVRSLRTAVEKRASHSFLFVGPSGVGKTTLAYLVADELGCEISERQDVDGATYTGVEDMRLITSGLDYKPLAGKVKVVIIDECHLLSKNAWTALLKMTEKPPSWVYWCFCTTEAGKVPAAIKTRSITYELKPVPVKQLDALLQVVARAERLKVSGEIIKLCSENAGGSPRQALAYLAACHGARDVEEAEGLMGSVTESKEAIDLARALYGDGNWAAVLGILKQMDKVNPESVRQVVRAYGTKIALSAPGKAPMAMDVLKHFATPFYGSDGITPLLLACAKVMNIK